MEVPDLALMLESYFQSNKQVFLLTYTRTPEMNFESSVRKVESKIYTEQRENPVKIRLLMTFVIISKCE